jgi:hypothetical protein
MSAASAQAEAANMVIYYGGDAIDLVLKVVLCCKWSPPPAWPAEPGR